MSGLSTRRGCRPGTARPVPGVAIAVSVLWVLAYAAATAGLRGSWLTFQSDVLYAVPAAAGAVIAAWTARRLRGLGQRRPSRAWSWVALSCGLGLVGDAIFAGYYYLGGVVDPFPSWADPVWIASEVALVPAVLYAFTRPKSGRGWCTLLDVVVAALGLDALLYVVLIRPNAAVKAPPIAAATVSYPVLDLVVLVVLLSAAGRIRRPWPVWLRLLAAAELASLATHLTAAFVGARQTDVAGSWLDLGSQVAAVLLALAGLAAARTAPPGAAARLGPADSSRLPAVVQLPETAEAYQLQKTANESDGASLLPILAGMFAVLAVEVLEAITGHVERPSLVLSGAVVMAVILRLLLSIGDQRAIAAALQVSLAEQQRLAITDVLTGLYNRRFIEELLMLETARALRDRNQVAVVIFDLDHFKAVNDTYGHQAGDAVLAEAAVRLRRGVRSSDVLGRWGGEEFLLVLRGADDADAVGIAQRARRELSAHPIRLPDGQTTIVTASAGVSCLPRHGMDADSLLWQADQALYAAKEAGRDRVLAASHVSLQEP